MAREQEEVSGPLKIVLDRRSTPAFWILLVLLCLLLVAGVLIFLPFWGPLCVAIVVTTLMHPVYARILAALGGKRRSLASAITCTLFLVLIVGPLSWLGFRIAEQATEAVGSVAGTLAAKLESLPEEEAFKDLLEEHPRLEENRAWIQEALEKLAAGLEASPGAPPPQAAPPEKETPSYEKISELSSEAGSGPVLSPEKLVHMAQITTAMITSLLAGAAGFAFKAILALFMMFFFFRDGQQILQSVRRGVPVDQEYQEKVIRTFQDVSRSMIKGTFLTALAQGLVAGITYAFLGIPALFWGAMTTVCALVPMLGTAIVTIPITLTFALDGQWAKAIVMLIVAVFIGTMDNILRPILVQKELSLHPAWVLLSVLGGVGVFGPLGILLGPMVLVLIRTVLALLLEEKARETQGVEPAGGS